MGRPLDSRGSPALGQAGRGRRGGHDRLKAGTVLYTSKAYISSEQNNSFYLMQKSEVECMFGRRWHTRRRGSWGGSRRALAVAAASPEAYSIFVLFVNTSG